jgi:hypothetical protein
MCVEMKQLLLGFAFIFLNSGCGSMRGGSLPYNYFEEICFLTSDDGILLSTSSMDSFYSVVKCKLNASLGPDGTNYQVVLVGRYRKERKKKDIEVEFLRDNCLGYHVEIENFNPACDKVYYLDSGESRQYLLEYKGRFNPEKDLREWEEVNLAKPFL